MKHINLDREDERIKSFIRSLPVDSSGSVLELEGVPVVEIFPVRKKSIDKAKLKAAILKRRDESRKQNAAWEAVDNEAWSNLPPMEE